MIYKIVASALLLLFYGCYFVKMLIQRQKGIQTDQIGKEKTGIVKVIEVTMKIVAILAPIVGTLSIFLIPTAPTMEWIRIMGAFFSCFGVVVFVCSVITMKDNWRAGVSKTDKTELVTNGIYKISRNPAFLGFDLMYTGILCMFFNRLLFVVTALTIIMFHLQIVNVEEDFLITTFGKEYIEYKSKVCRYFGRKNF